MRDGGGGAHGAGGEGQQAEGGGGAGHLLLPHTGLVIDNTLEPLSLHSSQRAWELEVEGVKMLLGYWWLLDCARAGPAYCPVVNSKPSFV